MQDYRREPPRCLGCDARLTGRNTYRFPFCSIACGLRFKSESRAKLNPSPKPSR